MTAPSTAGEGRKRNTKWVKRKCTNSDYDLLNEVFNPKEVKIIAITRLDTDH